MSVQQIFKNYLIPQYCIPVEFNSMTSNDYIISDYTNNSHISDHILPIMPENSALPSINNNNYVDGNSNYVNNNSNYVDDNNDYIGGNSEKEKQIKILFVVWIILFLIILIS